MWMKANLIAGKLKIAGAMKMAKKVIFLASDSWFDQYVYQAVVHKKYLSKEQLKAWDQKTHRT